MRGRPPRSALFPYATVFRSQALSRSFTTTANGSGQIVIAFTQGGADNPFIGGIEILSIYAEYTAALQTPPQIVCRILPKTNGPTNTTAPTNTPTTTNTPTPT